ncbi:MAG TPA: LamG-like jellyroll fold domain-containing protein [Rectinemataceae bacterium]|nr:LamG-like jellyroll fold domain-containing protein [Rectinemataceae bacterium]
MQLFGNGTGRSFAACLSLALLVAIPARALEERIVVAPGQTSVREAAPGVTIVAKDIAPTFGDWVADGAALRIGYRGEPEYVLAHDLYKADAGTDLLLPFDDAAMGDATGHWTKVGSSGPSLDSATPRLGAGAAYFNGPASILRLEPGRAALFADRSRFRDFSIEFWLYPADAENGEVILMWQSIRKSGTDTLAQQLSCLVSSGRLSWSFDNFFAAPDGAFRGVGAFPRTTDITLTAKSPLIPRSWSHHLIRFDADTGLLEYLVNGVPEDMAYVTSTGHEGGTVFTPAIGGASPISIGADYSGLLDEFRIERSFVSSPSLHPYGRDPALVLSPIVDLGYGHSRLLAVDAEEKIPGTSGIELSYRIADEAAAWSLDRPAWIPLRPGEPLPETARGRYAQVRAELYADGTGKLTPALSSLTFHFEPDPPPPPPSKLIAIPHDGSIELRWTRVPVADLGGYLVYYGDNPGEYMGKGAVEGDSPVDAGAALSFTLTGLTNGRLYFFAIASYDTPGTRAAGGTPTARAGSVSTEVAARPSRTSP